jgi:hypothetical protein
MAGSPRPTPAASSGPTTYVAVQSFVGNLGGRQVSFVKDEPVSADNPAVKRWPAMFTPQTFRHDAIDRIEQATAAPGEKRGG